MIELFLMGPDNNYPVDDSDLPFPLGTPFKGVVRSSDFITGSGLASQLGLTAGVPINDNSGWLHFVEDNGYNIYIAKKPLRCALNWASIDSAQTGKEIVIGGKTFVVEFIRGMKNLTGNGSTPADAGGAWNRYLYNVYGGELEAALPSAREKWGSYTEKMLGLSSVSESAIPGSYTYVLESGTGGRYNTRGGPGSETMPTIMGVWWGDVTNSQMHYGWRPMLVEKGTVPPVPTTPFKGEVAQADFITADALATEVGLGGTSTTTASTPWFKIIENGITYYLAKTSWRKAVVKETMASLGIVTGTKTVMIAGKTYKVRLMTGRVGNPSTVVGGEWLRWYTALTDGTWANYTATDLATGTLAVTDGTMVHVQEADGRVAGAQAANGYGGLMDGYYANSNQQHDAYGWRPVLELVE